MFTKSKIAVVTLVTGLTFASSAQANEVSLEQLVSAMMTQAINTTQQELRYNIEEAVLTATNMLSLNEEKTYVAKVTITDLDSAEQPKDKAE
jgi:hypothetical protein